mmetsp:Transcript_381/g.521  ORF Transcript_381/g.521 Transcript_381/m.521 type:complete len:80 (-) Transcript_381:61-300(-)
MTAREVLGLGELVDMHWRLGISMKSSNCTNLATPFVSVLLKVADSDKKETAHTFEMTLAQFQDFARNLHDISNLMESLS